jgi:hypothetical protein
MTGYIVKIRHSDDTTYSEELVNCDGSDPTIRDNTQCQIPISVLRTTPFS